MEKSWDIDGNKFTNRERAKEFFIVECKKNPIEYLDSCDIASEFRDYLFSKRLPDEHTWLLKVYSAMDSNQVNQPLNLLQDFLNNYINELAEDCIDDWYGKEE